MKVTIDFDCTPVEARAMMGLPDVTPIHDQYVTRLSEVMQKGVTPEMLEGMLKSWSPMGEGLQFWRRMFEHAGKSD